MLRYRFASFCMLIGSLSYCDLVDHLKPVGPKAPPSKMRNVDFIYGINLDRRPERWQNVLRQLARYKIVPHRFSAIDGWELPASVLNDIGVMITPETRRCPNVDKYGAYYLPDCTMEPVPLDESCYGRRFMSKHTRRGTVGCSLSHFSILEDAYNSGYNTIWVIEDDIKVVQNPHKISKLIDDLDRLVGKDGWDLLYTEKGFYPAFGDDRDKNLPEHSLWIWRPDMIHDDTSYIVRHENYSKDFIKVGLKFGTRSMIIRRSGMKKILDFAKNQGIFLPVDCDLVFTPGIRLFCVKRDFVSNYDLPSDTATRNP